jgi:hypothetical protein
MSQQESRYDSTYPAGAAGHKRMLAGEKLRVLDLRDLRHTCTSN